VVLSGRLADNNNRNLSNVRMSLSGNRLVETLTDKNGNYSFTNLLSGGNFTVTPLLPNFTFSPAQRSYTNLTTDQSRQNFTGTKTRFTVSGRVRSLVNGAQSSVGGANVTLTSGATQVGVATTDNNGNYTFANLMAGNYTVRATKPNFDVTPASSAVSVSPNDATADFTAQNLVNGLTGRISFLGNGAPTAVTPLRQPAKTPRLTRPARPLRR
jgi:hypothetical protein